MKNFRNISIALVLILTLAVPALAQGPKTYAVFPFKVNGPDKYLYLGPAVQSMLASRLTSPGKFEPVSKEAQNSLGVTPPTSGTQAQSLLLRAGAEYLFWGSVSVLGDQATLELQRQDVRGQSKSVSKTMPLDGLVPGLDEVAKQQLAELFGAPAQMAQKAEAKAAAAPSNPSFLLAEGVNPQDPMTQVNPQFRYEGGAETPGQWRTQNLGFASRGLTVADGDGDGRQEVFILGQRSLGAYSCKDGRLTPLDEVKFPQKHELLFLGSVDVDGDGSQDLVVGGYRDEQPYSQVFSFKGRKFSKIVDGVRVFLGVVATPPTYMPTLVGQKKGQNYLFDSRDVYEYSVSNGKVQEGKRINLPEFANVYNFCFLPDAAGYKIVLVDDENHIKVYNQNMDIQSSTEETYNGSAIDLSFSSGLPGMTGGSADFIKPNYYIPIPMKITSFSSKGKYELLVNKDISMAAQIFGRFRTFTQGELHGLFWDGVGLNLAWKTRRIKGTVVAFQIADPNNDGKQDLCVLVNTYPGSMGLDHRKTLLMGYELNSDNVQK
mgnify:CR=1 FL=1